MTQQRDFKSLVRERMSKTGERYTAARAHVLSRITAPSDGNQPAGLLKGYDRFGGVQGDTAVLHNVLRHAGIKFPLTGKPYDETTINGLCGGPGFLYAVFEYKGFPPMLTMVLRSRSMPDVYVEQGLGRLGVKFSQKQSSSPKPARKALDEALDAGKPAICTVDVGSLPWYGLPKEFVGCGPHTVAAVGRDNGRVWLDDRAPRPIGISREDFDNARGRYRAAKSRLITIDGPAEKFDAVAALEAALQDTVKSYHEYAVPKSFQSNCGFAGLQKWRTMLTDPRDKKGWPTTFAEGARAYAALHRLYDCVMYEYTAPAGGRAWYADFLDSAAEWLKRPRLRQAAQHWRKAGEGWSQVAALAADCGDKAVARACQLADRRAELCDEAADREPAAFADLWKQRSGLAGECKLSSDAARAVYAGIAEVVDRIIQAERDAAALMS